MACALVMCLWFLVLLLVVALCRAAKLGDAMQRLSTRLLGDGDD